MFMLGRNVDDHFAKTPTPHYPRSRFDMGIHKRLQTQEHGRLYPFFARAVYPGDTWQMDMSTFVRMDTSKRVPLDDVYLDTYWFFVPFRIIDKDFPKVLGEGEPEDYDDVSYGFPDFTLIGNWNEPTELFGINCLLPYLGYNQASVTYDSSNQVYDFDFGDHFNPYSLAALYKCYNDWFRDENVDPSIPYTDLYNNSVVGLGTMFIENETGDPNNVVNTFFNAPKVNKFHDYFSSSVIAPQKGPAVTIPLGTSAPIVGYAASSVSIVNPSTTATLKAGTYSTGDAIQFATGTILSALP